MRYQIGVISQNFNRANDRSNYSNINYPYDEVGFDIEEQTV